MRGWGAESLFAAAVSGCGPHRNVGKMGGCDNPTDRVGQRGARVDARRSTEMHTMVAGRTDGI